MEYRKTELKDLSFRPFEQIGKEWMLITAGDQKKFNTMTASWGGVGVLWNKNVATVYIRPQRYTKEFIDAGDTFSLTFFGEGYREALTLCGRKSGRDCNKVEEAGLTPVFDYAAPTFQEGKLVFICKKLYAQEMTPDCFLFDEIENNYPNKDYHTMYIGEILEVYQKD